VDLLRTLRPVALAVLLVGVGASGCAVGEAAPQSVPAPTSASPAAVAQRVGSVVPEAPQGIQLPDGRRVGIRAVGTTANGVLDVPSDIDVAGWWSGGSRLGDPFGSTLVAAHVDSRTQGLGPFASLLTVRPGDKVFVWSAGLKQAFRITSRRLRPQGAIGPSSPLHSPDGARRLTLVTCAGPYDAARGGYQNLAVVTAEPLGKAVRRP
jgi:hypothetical protein